MADSEVGHRRGHERLGADPPRLGRLASSEGNPRCGHRHPERSDESAQVDEPAVERRPGLHASVDRRRSDRSKLSVEHIGANSDSDVADERGGQHEDDEARRVLLDLGPVLAASALVLRLCGCSRGPRRPGS